MDTNTSVRPTAGALRAAALAVTAILGCAGAHAAGGPARLEQLPQQWLDDRGQPATLAEFSGHRVILSMAYTQCHHTCPTTFSQLQHMQAVLDQRGEQASFVIIGYDSEDDNPASWRQYRVNRRLGRGNWHFLTGTHQAVRQLARQLGFDYWIQDDHVLHDPRIVVFDSRGLLSATFTSATGNGLALL